jgi:molybdopterin synthase catalytic subunit
MARIDTEYLVSGPIKPALISDLISAGTKNKDAGAYSIFLGQVRADKIDGKAVKKIEYSAYKEMVFDEVDKIKKEITATFDDIKRMFIMHSIGEVKAGEISLVVLVTSGHREQSFVACREIVEKIKERLPVWKKEILDDNSHHWK